jgi:hypothetical protein
MGGFSALIVIVEVFEDFLIVLFKGTGSVGGKRWKE